LGEREVMSNTNERILSRVGPRSESRIRRSVCAGVCAIALLAAPATSFAGDGEVAKEAGIGAGSVLSTLIYGPVKLGYAIGGLTIGGLAWMFSGGDNQVARAIVIPSVAGDYVITPRALRGEDTIEFIGRDPEDRDNNDTSDVAAAPSDVAW